MDFIFPSELERITTKLNDVIVLPYLPYRLTLHHDEYQMTINIESRTLVNLIQDICHSIIKNGIRKILVINGHDGNIAPIDITFRYIKHKYPDIHAIQKYINEVGFYRNPTEFVTVTVREKIEEIYKRQIDKLKVDAFFIREQQIRAKHTNHSTV